MSVEPRPAGGTSQTSRKRESHTPRLASAAQSMGFVGHSFSSHGHGPASSHGAPAALAASCWSLASAAASAAASAVA
eukprot:CAMPEP_0115861198 /NCGR_PEP_ID=MMETSP0287-20121206/17530_1 /TAXON_ID=412157 /ORGANISM="Chrysochromulina rotalis, Strain UIO044" /LENGTH=76 /DNA_ID=CAMNT_0003315567 /DNA_START=501 /DNA_END=728 /DNA_ORIENTATION=-